MPRSTRRYAGSGVLPSNTHDAAAVPASRPSLPAAVVMSSAGSWSRRWRACQAGQNSRSSLPGAMNTSVPVPGGQERWSTRGARSMRSISSPVAAR